MHRITIAMILLLAALLASCGGGGTTAPDLTTNDDVTDNSDLTTVTGPTEVIGSHSTSVLEDQLNVLTGADEVALNTQLARFGITVNHKSGGWANLQLPAGMDLDWAATELAKEYNIATVEKVSVIQTPRSIYDIEDLSKTASYLPLDPSFADEFIHLDINADPYTYGSFIGQAPAMNASNFQAAWDVQQNASVQAREVRVAIISAGYFDYNSTDGWNRGSFDESLLDEDVSGAIDNTGAVTPGLDAAEWYIEDDGDPGTVETPVNTDGELVLGMLADTIGDSGNPGGYVLRAYDFDGSEALTSDEVWNEGIAGVNDAATYILIKTGTLSGENWTFSSSEVAEAIKYAAGDPADTNGGLWPNGGCGADIVLLTMFAEEAVPAVVSTALQTARDNDALVFAPAGDVVSTWDNDTQSFTGTAVDITTNPVWPASDPNCIAVSGTGFNRPGDLGDITIGEDTVPNLMIGWTPRFGDAENPSPFGFHNREVPDYCNSGGDIGAVGFGIGWSYYWFVVGSGTAGDPFLIQPGITWRLTVDSFGSLYAAAYAAGAASIVHQALHQADNAEPSDDDVWQAMQDTWAYAPIDGLANNGGLLDAGKAAENAVEGGSLFLPSMYLDNITVSQPLSYTEIETDFEITPTVMLGTAPFTIRVDWDNGAGEVEEAWTNGDPVTLTGGWDTLGQKGVNIEVEDADGQLDTFALWVHVVAPLGVGITIVDAQGTDYTDFNLTAATGYRFMANPTNIYTGEIDGTPNETTFTWDFDYDGVTFDSDATGTSPAHTYAAAGDYTIALLVEETVRPDRAFTMDVTVE